MTASTSWSGDYDPSKLVEGQNNPWHGRGNGKDQWLQFAFSEATPVAGFRYQAHDGWDGSSFKDYRFEKSDDGDNWVSVNEGQGVNLDCCEWEEITWDGWPKAKFFRLYMVNDWGYVVHAVLFCSAFTHHTRNQHCAHDLCRIRTTQNNN